MRMIIEARIDDGVGGGEAIRLAEFERLDGDLKLLGLNLAEGRSLATSWKIVGGTTDRVLGAAPHIDASFPRVGIETAEAWPHIIPATPSGSATSKKYPACWRKR
ncbi:hypothetical protein [Caballeronia sordidicola]|uniref:Uncharacterized protein n=1 Tax=Caballeronia sordidicola TaxID=196367 RepID=A0A226WWC6_CABSO|nr:hypothetical protein [Caballeronia sordidicola]OXC74878.1 hypothetical protein BSU04_29910 [Caballeronia sordidicola]